MILLFLLLTKPPFGGCVVFLVISGLFLQSYNGCVATLQGGARDTQDVGGHSRQVNGSMIEIVLDLHLFIIVHRLYQFKLFLSSS